MQEIILTIVEEFGLLPLYTVIVVFLGFAAWKFKHLFYVLAIACGVYITMFQAFNLKANFGGLDVTQFIPVSQDIGNMIMATVFVYAIGISAYIMKSILFAQMR